MRATSPHSPGAQSRPDRMDRQWTAWSPARRV